MKNNFPIDAPLCKSCTLPTSHCICQHVPPVEGNLAIWLVRHEKEMDRLSNTGHLLSLILGDRVKTSVWSRTSASAHLLKALEDPAYAPWLVFPIDGLEEGLLQTRPFGLTPGKTPLYVVIDATWKEAKKIVRKSPYLQKLPVLSLDPTGPSAFVLRRNQRQGHLCTLEVGAALVDKSGFGGGKTILDFFDRYQGAFMAAKCGHGPVK